MSAPSAPSEPSVPSAPSVLPKPSAPRALGATVRVHEPRRADCPWCGSPRLGTRLRTPDLRQHKPGVFTVDACRDCGHTFQNPRLTTEGLAFYHQDLHPGLLEHVTERVLALRHSRRRHRRAARAMLRFGEPESWLDVGTGHARFPEAAREFFPYTSFDGLDHTRRVEEGRAAGRVEEAYVGRLTDPRIAARVRARYDVVSMFHHLEHTPDPRGELRAALAVLRPGGHLLVELTDPGCVFATLLGRGWLPYDQPRHLHLMPPANLRAELEAQGCVIVTAGHRAAHVPCDLAGAAALALVRAVPAPDTPWRPLPPTQFQCHLRTALLYAGIPLVAAAAATDHALAPLLHRTRFANTYRIIARKEAI